MNNKKFFPSIGLFLLLLATAACSRTPTNAPEAVSTPLATLPTQVNPTPSPASELALLEPTPTAENSLDETTAPAQPTPTPEAGLSPTPEASPTAVPTGEAQPTPAQPACTDLAAFYGDVSIPDGTFFRAGERFTKTWRFRNNGDCTWTPAYSIVFASGEMMNAPLSNPFPGPVAPGEQVDISIEMEAPGRGGAHTGSWEFANPSGQRFGAGVAGGIPFWVTISVSFIDLQGQALPSGPVAGHSGPVAAPSGCPAVSDSSQAAEVIALVNQARQENGLAALTSNPALAAAALGHSLDMDCNNYLNHTGSDGSTWYDRVRAEGYAFNKALENIFAGDPGYGGDPASVVAWWLKSAIHRAAILNPEVSEIGVGVSTGGNGQYGAYFTAVFARP
jgi:uncharacterized protein YkwD